MEGEYVYKSLRDSGSIRVLIIQPSQRLTDLLVGSLKEVSVDEASYTALSYSWAIQEDDRNPKSGRVSLEQLPGDSSPTEPLMLEDVKVLIGKNLHDALRRLREKSSQPSYLWIDAVCINQRDDVEKSIQVAMMASVYRNATQVVAWLGEGEERNNQAASIALQCLIAEQAEYGVELENEWNAAASLGQYRTIDPWILRHDWVPLSSGLQDWEQPGKDCERCRERRCSISAQDIPPLQGLGWLAHRRYFERLWVVQEVLIPHTDRVALQWGGQTIIGNPLDLWAQFSISVNSHAGKFGISKGRARHKTAAQRPLWDLLAFCSRKQCFDPRDKLYAVLGMMPDSGKHFKPDYSSSIEEVYGEFARYMIEQRQLFILLKNCAAEQDRLDDALPTWIPDLRMGFGYEGALQDIGRPLTTVNSADSVALWEYVQPTMCNDGLLLSSNLCYYGTVQPSGEERIFQVEWEPHMVSGLNINAQSAVEETQPHRQLVTISWEVDHAVRLEGDPSGCIVCSAHPVFDFFRPLLRPDAERPGLWRIVGGWSRFQYQGPDYGPNERRLYRLS